MLIEFLYNSEVDYDYPFAVNTAVRFDSKKKEALSFLNDVEGGSCEIALAGKKVLRVPYIIQKDKYSPPIPGKISYSMLFVDSDNNLWIEREIVEENLWFINYGEEIQEGDVMIMRISLNDGAITPILEFGKDFTFIGEEYRVQVGGQDFYIDLLFYNRALSCLVAIELKIGKFKPEHIGQLNFYLEALDRDVKKTNENPSVGVILCATKDDAVVEYALSRSMSPTMVAEYTLKLPDKKLLENKLREITLLTDDLKDE